MAAIGNSSNSELINGRYRTLYPLQEGGFGQTFLVEDTQLPSQRRCVLKLLKPVADNHEFYRLIQDRFQREAAIQETLGEACQQIPRLYAYFSEADNFYLVEEWIDGDTLTAKVAEVGRFSEARVIEVLSQLLLTIDTVHQHHIIHRDIKPDNIILRRRDGIPVLIDFGAVKESMGAMVNSQGASGRSIVIGTASYMAPEQSAGRPLYSSDLYSLGLTAIYLLTGRSPSELDHDPRTGKVEWRSQSSRIGAGLAKFIDKAIQMHPQDRFSSAQEMLQALQAVQTAAAQDDVPTILNPTATPDLKGTPQAFAIPVAPPAAPSAPNPVQAGQPPFIPQDQSPHQSPSQPQYQPPYQNPSHPHQQYPSQPQYPADPFPPGQGQPSAPQIPATVVSGQHPHGGETQVVAPSFPQNPTNAYSADPYGTPPKSNEWLKAALIGGGIGGGLLIGLLLVRSQQPSPSVPSPSALPSAISSGSPTPTEVASQPSPSPSPSPEASPETSPNASPNTSPEASPEASLEPSPSPTITASATCGDPSGSGPNWYPVFIDNADLGEVQRTYCGDAIAKVRDNGTPAVQVASFTDRGRAENFAAQVGGDVGEPYQVGGTQPSPSPDSAPAGGDTNAVIIGDSSSKNIRRGPGSQFPVQHIAYPGDRVKILGSDQDRGGYVWYRVYFPKSGASGWIAGQLIQTD
ncbi:MAG: protein kinase [Thermosynechococcaceae cyanobacterium MS004]|nr:protein kinase [Thermosynechococcaceae cyanobacterium MS004]